jgi:4-hydroxybenzoate polyprenyltransferase
MSEVIASYQTRAMPPSLLCDWWTALRPRQWPKNLVALAALLFSGQFRYGAMVLTALAGVAVLCALSSAGYLLNDVLDSHRDRAHPRKRLRPIAAGRVSAPAAVIVSLLLAGGALAAAWRLGWLFAAVALGYLLVTISYSLYWKHRVLLDLLAIAAAFLLRGVAGAAALQVVISPWLFLCLSLLALLLAVGKRRHEVGLTEGSDACRPVLADYSQPFLDQALTMVSAAAVVIYAIYALLSPTATAHPWLVATVPPVLYGVLRYLYLVFHHERGGEPEELFFSDRPLALAVGVWALTAVAALLWS